MLGKSGFKEMAGAGALTSHAAREPIMIRHSEYSVETNTEKVLYSEEKNPLHNRTLRLFTIILILKRITLVLLSC